MLGVWLVQLGTPEAPTRAATKAYLDEFLMDPRMIELPFRARWLLVKALITPFRSGKTAHAYSKIWMTEGSPLAVYSERFAQKLQAELGSSYFVQLGMRYGEPSIAESWKNFRQHACERVLVLPMFPQYCTATTASVFDKIAEVLKAETHLPALEFIPPFYKRNEFIQAFVQRGIAQNVKSYDHVLFSFHGIPEKLVRRAGSACMLMDQCCLRTENHFCYLNHCVRTAEQIREGLGLDSQRTSICFQSRLGREKWLDPYTDHVVKELPKKGIKRLAVFCPSFVADCLETLEEIGMRAKEDFLMAGGQELTLVSSLNDMPEWVSGVARWIKAKS